VAKPGTIIQLAVFRDYLVALDNQGNWFSAIPDPTLHDPQKEQAPTLSLIWSQMALPDTTAGPATQANATV